MSEQFSPEETEILKTFCSNIHKSIFVLQNLPEVIKGALFSRYSRTTKSLRRLLIDEFIKDKETGFADIAKYQGGNAEALGIAIQKAHAFYDRVLDGYGDDSVGELGGTHIACEQVSNMASKVLEDARLGGSPLEKSTRYVYFNDKVDGEYQFYKEPTLMGSSFREPYLQINTLLFDTYSELLEPMKAFLIARMPLAEFEFFDITSKQTVKFSQLTDEKTIKRANVAYTSAVRAKACDVLRGLLPASTLTNVGIFGNGRFFQGLLTKMYSHPLAEMRTLAADMHRELDTAIPSFVRRAKTDEYLTQTAASVRAETLALVQQPPTQVQQVTLLDYDADAEDKILAAILYPNSAVPLAQLRTQVQKLSPEERKQLIATYVGKRRHRRDKPGRAFEQAYYTFDIIGDYGIYRDLQRHRILSQERQLLSTLHGYDTPEEFEQAGFGEKYHAAMRAAAEAYTAIAAVHPFEAQYVVPLAYNIRWYMKMNLREAYHFCELRAGQQGHPSYRKVAQLMAKEIVRVHPVLAAGMTFVDYHEYKLERINAEMRSEEKREARKTS